MGEVMWLQQWPLEKGPWQEQPSRAAESSASRRVRSPHKASSSMGSCLCHLLQVNGKHVKSEKQDSPTAPCTV
ncbi:hypothetical protein E2320_019900 [Naja naja]|nr:hypothetical protein E2320_019900 [Naja naja]